MYFLISSDAKNDKNAQYNRCGMQKTHEESGFDGN